MATSIAGLGLKNPVLVASSEMTMDEGGIVGCIEAGAAAVVAKSVNESPAAARQLDSAEYLLVAEDRTKVPWAERTGGESLFCRSGLGRGSLSDWCAMLERCQCQAAERGAFVIGSVTVGEVDAAAVIARRLAEVVPAVELNVGAPHGREAAAISQLTDTAQVKACVGAVRAAVDCPLLVKLPSQASDVVDLARTAVASGADAVVLAGRFNAFMPDLETWEPLLGSWGVIGGGWALPLSLYWVSKCHRELEPTTLIATNGVRSGHDVARSLLSGARAVELASVLFTEGPEAIGRILIELDTYMAEREVADIESMVGASARRARRYAEMLASGSSRPWEQPGIRCG